MKPIAFKYDQPVGCYFVLSLYTGFGVAWHLMNLYSACRTWENEGLP